MRSLGLILVAVQILGSSLSCKAAPYIPAEKNSSYYFLPGTSVPHHYDLELNVFLGAQKFFNGSVGIDITVLQATNELVLHADGLQIDVRRSLVQGNNLYLPVNAARVNPDNQFLHLNFSRVIPAGNYTLKIVFRGQYYTYSNGLFISPYTLPNNQTKELLATHFEPNRARDMFPCYDEPNLKATFTVTVNHPSNYSAISNMPVVSVTPNAGNRTTTKFDKTPRMSTYLLALAVADYTTLEDSYDGIKFHLYVPPGSAADTRFSLNVTRESIRHYHNVLKVNYSLPKLDGVVVPIFGGGMENWGLIVYGDMIIVSDTSSDFSKSVAVNLIAHEIGHQWFGNLVTLDWWDYTWLNEGFASYYSHRIGDLVEPKYRAMDNEVIQFDYLKQSEAYSASRDTLNRHVEAPDELGMKFNSIGYTRGSAIVRFMSQVFTDFDRSITEYLNRRSYKNAVPSDLFQVINERAQLPTGANVSEIMKNWVNNPGLPLITVNVSSVNKVYITQERFLIDGKPNATEKWWIPITLVAQSNPDFDKVQPVTWMREQDDYIFAQVPGGDNDWVLANVQQAVYARVNYDLDNWHRIITFLKGPQFEKIHPLNRAALLSDSHQLAKVGKMPESYVLDLLSYLPQETDPVVRSAAKQSLVAYAELLRGTPARSRFDRFVRSIHGPTESKEILERPSIHPLVEKAVAAMQTKHENALNAISKITERVYDDSDFKSVLSAVSGKNRASLSPKLAELIEMVRVSADRNRELKQKFMEKNYYDVEKWLTERF